MWPQKYILLATVVLTGCMKSGININIQTGRGLDLGNGIGEIINPSVLPPEPPSIISVTPVPEVLNESAVFDITESSVADQTEVKILKKSDNSIIKDWTPISSGGKVTGITLESGETYYAVFRSVNDAGTSPEVVSPEWTPVVSSCTPAQKANAPYAGGDGSATSPYLICTATQFAQIAANSSHFKSHFKLAENIDLSSVTFNGIGNSTFPFRGTFDGNGKTIENYSITTMSFSERAIFNHLVNAQIHNVRVKNISITAAMASYISGLSARCERSQIRNVHLEDINLTGNNYVGAVVGYGYECSVLSTSAAGSVKGLEKVGGVSGTMMKSDLFNVTSAVNVQGANQVGGITGSGFYTNIQNSKTTGTIDGSTDVGGLAGVFNGYIFRSEFSGSITGADKVGGIIGSGSDNVMLNMVSTSFTITADLSAGGAIGFNEVNVSASNILTVGTINITGSNGAAAGGMFGSVIEMPYTEYSLSVVNITGAAERAGGFVGESQDLTIGSYNLGNVAVVSNVQGASASQGVSLFSGTSATPIPSTTAYYWLGGSCTNSNSGICNTTYGQAVGDVNMFYNKSSEVYAPWNFTSVWKENPGTFPSLLTDSKLTTSYTTSCPSDAFIDVYYRCDLGVNNSAGDKNELNTIAYADDNTCRWMYASLTTHKGLSVPEDAGPCTASFTVTDGINSNAKDSFNVTVHDEIRFSPTIGENGLFVKSQNINTGISSVALTLTNTKAIALPITFNSPMITSAIWRSGGTCGASIPATGSCTIEFSFDPYEEGITTEFFSLTYTSPDGTFTIPIQAYGYGVN